MEFGIDHVIVLGFLILTMMVGLNHGKSVKTIKDYALGGRNFSTGALIATVVATKASGSGFFTTLSKTYSEGFYYTFSSIGIGISLIIIALLLVPRMAEFLGNTSIAEAMGDLYGNHVRVITAVSGTIAGIGSLAVQFKVFGYIVAYFVGLSPQFAIISAGIIATIYSAFGGIKAVTFTDVLQAVAFGVIIPLLGFVIWSKFFYGNYSLVTAFSDPKFDLGSLLNVKNSGFGGFLFLLIYFCSPIISAHEFQRISMGKNITQAKNAFLISGIVLILIKFSIAWIPFIIKAINPSLPADKLLPHIITNYSFIGLKGMIIVAIIAFAMSTADSMINSSSVLFTNDIYGVFAKNEDSHLLVAKLFALLLGCGTIFLSLVETDLLGLIIFTGSFFYPVVTPPFLLAIFGFRSTPKVILIGMLSGLIGTIIWHFLPNGAICKMQDVLGVFATMLINALFLIGSHYLLKQPGGWAQDELVVKKK